MKKIENFSSIDGRILLQDIYRELRYSKQRGAVVSLFLCWKICVNELDINKYVNLDAIILHRLGLFRGTALWMEEIVNRFYFSTINSFVYFGAAVLLVLIGVRKFGNNVDDSIVLWGIVFEATMLLFMFIVMLFSPNESIEEISGINSSIDGMNDEIITEIGEIGRDFAAAVVQLENIALQMNNMAHSQQLLLDQITLVAQSAQAAVSPNPEMIAHIEKTNETLIDFKNTIQQLNKSASELKKEQIEITVRRELEKIISNRAF